MSKKIEKATCPYCGNDEDFREEVDGLNIAYTYGWNEDIQQYAFIDEEHGDHMDARLICANCVKELPAEEYEKFLEAL